MDPDVGHRQNQILGEGAGPVHADAFGVRAKVAPSCKAIAAAPADHVSLAADDLPRIKIRHIRAGFHDFAHKFESDYHWDRDGACRPIIPFINVEIGAANAGAMDSDEYVIDADTRFGNVFEPEARFGFGFDERFHGFELSVKSNLCTI